MLLALEVLHYQQTKNFVFYNVILCNKLFDDYNDMVNVMMMMMMIIIIIMTMVMMMLLLLLLLLMMMIIIIIIIIIIKS